MEGLHIRKDKDIGIGAGGTEDESFYLLTTPLLMTQMNGMKDRNKRCSFLSLYPDSYPHLSLRLSPCLLLCCQHHRSPSQSLYLPRIIRVGRVYLKGYNVPSANKASVTIPPPPHPSPPVQCGLDSYASTEEMFTMPVTLRLEAGTAGIYGLHSACHTNDNHVCA